MATRNTHDMNRDAITGAPGSHPVGTGLGAAGGGAAGAAIGSAAGPVGTVVGAVAGAVAGGLGGKAVAEQVDPTAEDAYWRANYANREYVTSGTDYTHYAPAYRYGWESRGQHADRSFDEVEPSLRERWALARGTSQLDWDAARPAVRDAWERTGAQTIEGRASVPVVEEQLHVGKREVERGGVRVRSTVQEKPVEAEVTLREERAVVERRPVDRPASESDFARAGRDAAVEVRERAEVPVVDKHARVVEEVIVGKEVEQRTETVRDTVRRTDVEVEEVDAAMLRKRPAEDKNRSAR